MKSITEIKYVISIVFAVSILVSCAGSKPSVTVSGKAVRLPSDVAKEHLKLVENIGLYNDPELAAYVNEIGQRLVANSSTPDQPFTFTLLDSPDINAFALPGGMIYINRGLLAYLDSEAELAGVIAHEIGHITERHHSRRRSQSITSQVAAVSAYILTGSGDLYDATTMYGAELISGFGREMELEADSAGAEFMHRSGYEADSLLSVIGVLKDQEQYRRVKAKQRGKPAGTYHGLYASHPRNDLRLKTVITAANSLDLDSMPDNPEEPGRFRRLTDGLVFGASAEAQSDPLRFYHNKLDFTIERPSGWSVTTTPTVITLASADGGHTLKIRIAVIDAAQSTRELLSSQVKGDVTVITEINQATLSGHSAIAEANGISQRVAAIDHRYRFLFEGASSSFDDGDKYFQRMIDSFRPLFPKEKINGTSHTLRYAQVPRGATLKTLSLGVSLPDAEEQLRLINGYYPRGEPRTGDWIKIIR